MRYQSDPSSCGAVALSNAVRLLRDLPILEEWVMNVAPTTGPDGTGTKNIIKAAHLAGLDARKLRSKKFPDECNDVMIMAVDMDSHWVVAQKMCNGRYLVVDGAAVRDAAYSMSAGDLMVRACNGKNPKKPYTAVVLTEGKSGSKMFNEVVLREIV